MSKALVVSNIPHDMVQQELLDLLRFICPFKTASVNEGIDQLGRKTATVFVHSFFEAQKVIFRSLYEETSANTLTGG